VARSADAPRLAGRDLGDAWEIAIEATGLPLHRPAGRARARVSFGAPLQLGIAAERELADVLMASRVPIWQMREALDGRLPTGWTLVDLFDVWVGGPALAGRVVAADYRIELGGWVDPAAIDGAARAVLDARELLRVRPKGETTVTYDLRPLLHRIDVEGGLNDVCLRIRTRIHPELGAGQPLEVREVVRERLILADDPG
jgi:hypothetical protein